jgi:hypothetical protein
MRAREKLFKQKVTQMTRYDQKCFQKIQGGGHFRFARISATIRFRDKLFRQSDPCVLEKNFSNKK